MVKGKSQFNSLGFIPSVNSSTGTLSGVSTSLPNLKFTGASSVTVEGFANGYDGKQIIVQNSSSASLTLKNATGTSSEQIITGTGSDLSLPVNSAVSLIYESTSSKWRVIGSAGGSGGGHTIEDEGVTLPTEPILNFVGAGVTVTDSGGKTVVTIPGSGGGMTVTSIQSSSYTASSNEEVPVDSSGGSLNITLPLSTLPPSHGDKVKVIDVMGTFSVNNVTVLRNGSNINGLPSDLVLDLDRSSTELEFFTGIGWVVN